MYLSEATDVVKLALSRFQVVVFLPRFREGEKLKGPLGLLKWPFWEYHKKLKIRVEVNDNIHYLRHNIKNLCCNTVSRQVVHTNEVFVYILYTLTGRDLQCGFCVVLSCFFLIQFQPPSFYWCVLNTEHLTLAGDSNNITPAHVHRNTSPACHHNETPSRPGHTNISNAKCSPEMMLRKHRNVLRKNKPKCQNVWKTQRL